MRGRRQEDAQLHRFVPAHPEHVRNNSGQIVGRRTAADLPEAVRRRPAAGMAPGGIVTRPRMTLLLDEPDLDSSYLGILGWPTAAGV